MPHNHMHIFLYILVGRLWVGQRSTAHSTRRISPLDVVDESAKIARHGVSFRLGLFLALGFTLTTVAVVCVLTVSILV